MKTIGLIGGMSWESTAHYYALLNKKVNERLGGHHSAKILLYSIDFEELATRQFADHWDEANAIVVDAAKRLECGGADFLLICANTMHIAAERVEQSVRIPLLHIADATGVSITSRGLRQKFGLDVRVPPPEHRKLVHDIIYDELVRGIVKAESKARLRNVIANLITAGAEGIILGCTELMMIVEEADSAVPLFDTTTIHSEAAVERALA
jgi:aspartate racemase